MENMSVETNTSAPSVEETSEDILVREKKGRKLFLNKEKVDVLNVLKVKASQGSAPPPPHEKLC